MSNLNEQELLTGINAISALVNSENTQAAMTYQPDVPDVQDSLQTISLVMESAQVSSELHVSSDLNTEMVANIEYEEDVEEQQTEDMHEAPANISESMFLTSNHVLESSGLNQTSRFEDAPWFNFTGFITVVGCGGIGSWATMYLSKAFPKASIVVYDYDIVELHNMAGQLFSFADIGRSKVDAVKLTTELLGSNNVSGATISLNDISEAVFYDSSIIIAAFDNNEARRRLLNKAKKFRKPFIDGRLRASMFEVFCVDTTNEEQVNIYLNTLVDDSLVDDGPCSFKQTSHVAGMIGSYITAVATAIASNIEKKQRRPIPFYSNFIINGFMFNKMTAEQYKLWKQ